MNETNNANRSDWLQRVTVRVAQLDKYIRGDQWRELSHALYTWMAPLYDWGVRVLTPDYGRMAEGLLESLQVTSEDQALDLGCGTGMVTLPTAQRTQWATGIDLTPGMLRQLQRKNKEIPLVRGDVRFLPFAPRSFSAVTTSFVLLHLTTAEKQQVFGQVQRVLRPSGRFGCLTGQEHVTDAYTTAEEWCACLTEHGFENVVVTDPDGIYRIVTARSGSN